MEHVGSLAEGEWSCSLGGMYNSTEEADFMAQLLANNPPLPINLESCSSLGDYPFWPGQESLAEMATNPNMFYFLQGSSNIHRDIFSSFFPTQMMGNVNSILNDYSHANAINPVSNDGPMAMELCTGDGKITCSYLAEETDCMNQRNIEHNVDQESCGQQLESCIPDSSLQVDKRPAVPDSDEPMQERGTISKNRKRSRNAEGQKSKRTRRNQKRVPAEENEEENNVGKTGLSPSACCSEDDSNASQEQQNGVSPSESSKDQPTALNSYGKSRASRGTATDPQSLYARKRRERINERLRILQSLVPNGTKVDISTMLEEAVEYVKFLQLQIKLLSSDDLWMYSPIAYNGMNIGLDLNIPMPPKRS